MADSSGLDSFFKNINSDLYSFSYALIPDDLQVQQLILDAIGLFIDVEEELLLDFMSLKKGQVNLLYQFKKIIYRNIFHTAKKRLEQLKGGLGETKEFIPFYSLNVNQRAVLFLKHKTKFEWIFMEEVTGLDRHDIMELLGSGRNKLLDNSAIGLEVPTIL